MTSTRRLIRILVVLLTGGLLVALLIPIATQPTRAGQQSIALAPGDQVTITCGNGLDGTIQGSQATILCALPAAPTSASALVGPAVTGFTGVQEGQALSGKVVIEALVTGDNIARVAFKLNGPKSDAFNDRRGRYFFKGDREGTPIGWNTTRIPDGDYTLTATATDTKGQSNARVVHFRIANAASPQPTATAISIQPTATAISTPTSSTPVPGTGALSIAVAGNHFVNQNGETVRLLGVNRSGTQYMCYDGGEFFDGPADDASIRAMTAWGITAVRVNLNEHCWLGLSDVPSGYGGDAYRKAIGDFVNRLNAHGLYVILDMHHSGPGLNSAKGQQPMADRDHAVAYWSSVAAYFKQNHAVLFDLFNEPYPDKNRSTTAAWQCVRDGGTCAGVGFVAEGMQQMLDAVRATGSTNPVLISGPEYAGTLNRWLEFKPNDPLNQLAASLHVYGQPLGSPYDDPATWDAQIAPVAAQVPVVMGEIGDTDCTHTFVDRLLPWADAHGVSYLAWSWIVGSCADEPSLITNYNGTPSKYGVGVRDHLLSLPR